jgi:hypothetical protein
MIGKYILFLLSIGEANIGYSTSLENIASILTGREIEHPISMIQLEEIARKVKIPSPSGNDSYLYNQSNKKYIIFNNDSLPDIEIYAKNIKILRILYCPKLKSIPSLDSMINLKTLEIVGNSMNSVNWDSIISTLKTLVQSYKLCYITLPNRCTSIGDYALAMCPSLVSINIPEVMEIGDYAFSECTSLVSINISNVKSINNYTFYNCTSLVSIDIPEVIEIDGYAFSKCTELVSINIPEVMEIGNYAFSECTNLVSINIPNVKSINNYAFYNCTSLVSIDIPNVLNIYPWIFFNCVSLQSVTISNVFIKGNMDNIYSSAFWNVPLSCIIIRKGMVKKTLGELFDEVGEEVNDDNYVSEDNYYEGKWIRKINISVTDILI